MTQHGGKAVGGSMVDRRFAMVFAGLRRAHIRQAISLDSRCCGRDE